MHGAYGLGGMLAPLAATAMIASAGLEWYAFFYIMCGLLVLELVVGLAVFWKADGRAFREELGRAQSVGGGGDRGAKGGGVLRKVLGSRVVWICSIFLLMYVGSEVSISGWTVTFSMSSENFWAGFSPGWNWFC